MSKRTLLIIGAVGVFVVVPLLIWLVVIFSQVRQGVEFIIVPGSATAVINEKEYSVSHESRLRLEPGTYTVTLKADDFSQSEKEVTVVEGEVTQLYMALKPLTDEAAARIDQHQRERIGGVEVTEGGEALVKEYDFMKHLPLTRKMFHAYPCQETPESEMHICVRIAVQSDIQKQRAIDELRNVGIDVDTVKITFDPPQGKSLH